MGIIERVREKAGRWVRGRPVEGEVSPRPALPLPSRLGAMGLLRGAKGPIAAGVPQDWGVCPATGGALPTGPNVQVTPWQFVAARAGLRHGWFPALAWANDPQAEPAMAAWLRQDLPGQGLAWAHPTDLAVRMVHWHAGLAFLGEAPPDALRDAMAGSAHWHIRHLLARLPQGERDVLRRVVHAAGLVVAGFTFPELPNAREAWSTGLALCKQELPALAFEDGSPRDVAPLMLADALWQVSIARAVASANGAGFPAQADAAFARCARFLERLSGGVGALPPVGEAPVAPVLDSGEPIGPALWDAALAWGLEPGEPAALPTPARLGWLGLAAAGDRPESPKSWSMRVYREGGVVIGESRIKNRPSRATAWFGSVGRKSPLSHVAPMQLLWDIGDVAVLADPGPAFWSPGHEDAVTASGAHSGLSVDGHLPGSEGGELTLARVDGKKARAEGRYLGWRAQTGLEHERDVLFNQARCLVTDRLVSPGGKPGRHAVALRWQLGPGWEVTREGENWQAKHAGMTLVIQLPAALSWELATGREAPGAAGWVGGNAAPCFIGNGGIEGDVELVSSFEVR